MARPTRKAIYTEAFSHSNPIPAACRMGDLVLSGIINGLDPGKPKEPGTFEQQCERMFSRIAGVMAAAGGTIDDIVKINIAVADLAQREPINREWVKMFPDPATRPVRQTVHAALDRGKLIQCDLMAWLGDRT